MNRLQVFVCVGSVLAVTLTAVVAGPGGYEVSWYTIDNGGATSTDGAFSVSGTIAQPDAGPPMAGGAYAIQAGFWSGGPIIQAPCDAWTDMDGGIPNPGSIWALTVHNGNLIAGGDFATAGSQSANNVARWHDSFWEPLGNGLNGKVEALSVHNNELFVAGQFFFVKRWNGSNWENVGGAFNSSVYALTVYNGQLIAGGSFSLAGGQAANNIARWDASSASWQPLGNGLNMTVRALAVYNGELIAGGQEGPSPTAHLARWNGSLWQVVGSGISSVAVYALKVFNNELIVGGWIPAIQSTYVARWNGSGSLQSFVPGLPNLGGPVYSLTTYNNDLIVGGQDSGFQSNFLFRWDGSSWQWMGNGVQYFNVRALAVDNDMLVAGGAVQLNGTWVNIARWRDCSIPPVPGDITGDGVVDVDDLIAVILSWGPCPAPPASCPADVAPNGQVDVDDLIMVILNWD